MSEELVLLRDTARRIFSENCPAEVVERAEAGDRPDELWQTLEAAGLTSAGIGEAAGGVGGEPHWGVAVISEAARFAAPVPIAETWLAARILEASAQSSPAGRMTVASGSFELKEDRVFGEATAVPFAAWVDHFVFVGVNFVALVAATDVGVELVSNIAGEPSADVNVDAVPISVANATAQAQLLEEGAVVRAGMIAGALEFMLESGVQFASERDQFGRPISKFQAIQHQLAMMAGEVAAARRVADLAAAALTKSGTAAFSGLAAAAKARCGEAAGVCSDIAHQVHGAMGYTRDHPLNLRSRRIWRWRDDFGHERFWNQRLGARALERGADDLWGFLTDLS